MELSALQSIFPTLERSLLEEMVLHGQVRKVAAGETLLKTGQTIRSTMLLLEGLVKLYREDESGKEYFIYHLEAGQACSLSMVCAARQEASEVLARALTDAVVLSIPLPYMDSWMRAYRSWYEFVISSYRGRMEELLRTIDAIAFTRLDERLESYLQKASEKLGPLLKSTHGEIAADLGSSREVVSRLLKKMEAQGWLAIHRSSVEWFGRGGAV